MSLLKLITDKWRETRPAEQEATAPPDELPATLAPHLALGQRGERLAAAFLASAGYRLVAANFRIPVGRSLRGALVRAEIDLIAYDGPVLCFVEVKTRASDWFAAPEANVDLRKQRQISRAARAYRRIFGLTGAAYRYDVVAVILEPVGDLAPDSDLAPTAADTRNALSPPPRLELLRNFWTDAKFRKRRWTDSPADF